MTVLCIREWVPDFFKVRYSRKYPVIILGEVLFQQSILEENSQLKRVAYQEYGIFHVVD